MIYYWKNIIESDSFIGMQKFVMDNVLVILMVRSWSLSDVSKSVKINNSHS